DPRLAVQARYILFLKTLNKPPFQKEGGVRMMYGGFSGIEAYPDEYNVAHPWLAKLRLEQGAVTLPGDPLVPVAPWRFEEDNLSLLGMREDLAIALIAQTVAA